MGAERSVKVMVWNVNGLRACARKGFADWLEARRPSVLGLQETRAHEHQLEGVFDPPRGYRFHLNPAERPGYSGVGLLSRRVPREVLTSLGEERFDREGRVQIAIYDGWALLNVYFPNGKGKERDNSRVPYKLEFYEAVLKMAESLRREGLGVVVGGDWNTAHREIDLENWKQNRETSGFLDIERAEIDRWLAAGWHDVFREAHPDRNGLYTWWSQRGGARARNVGWRIDYLLVSRELRPHVRRAWIEPEIMGSDHCPLGIDLVLPRGGLRKKA